jgi:hypothetical protein
MTRVRLELRQAQDEGNRGERSSTPVVSLSNHGKAGVAVLRQAQDEGGVRGAVSSNPVVSLSNHSERKCAVHAARSGAKP